ncbi:hypothetical protein R5W24_004948 [Gemmata sp. JC717]|uniref:hypothetical protein n=1 Tax=Gemmata algarum TaxID=2975278 RepID=UPI0021BA5B68|nr:hypothetical protein [Gemmata algarum]MDY3555802.1 hypothetical protein [Gemmata algarum]
MPIWGWVCVALTVAAVAFVVYANVVDRKRRARTLEQGDQTHGWLVQANSALFEDGHMDLPALVVISPDPDTNDDEEFMTDLAARIMDLKSETGRVIGRTKAERAVSKLMSDETYIEGRRDRLPDEFTDGREVYLAHIFIYRDHLPLKRLEDRQVLCAVVWDDDAAMICTRPMPRKRRRRDDD